LEMDFFTLDGVSSATKSVILLDADLADIERKREETTLPNRLDAIQSDYWQWEPKDIPLQLAVIGDSMQDVTAKYLSARRWLLSAGRISLSEMPDRHYQGSITKVTKGEANDRWLKFTAVFRANPWCLHKALSKQSGFVPLSTTPIPEQITAATETCSGAFTAAGSLPEVAYAGACPAALYMTITGTWTTLAIGGSGGWVINWPSPQSMTLYIDCVSQHVYHKIGGVMTDIGGYVSGDPPAMAGTLALPIGGTNLNITARLLVIERE